MTTLKDLSRHLGLSVTQVSRALNNYDDVSAATKDRVHEAAKALNYIPNMTARRLATGRSNIVGLVWQGVPQQSESLVFAQFVGGLSAEFNAIGLQFVLNMARDEASALASYERLIASQSIDGFVLILPQVKDRRVRLLQDRGVPFVMHGQTMDDPNYAFYDIDNLAVGTDLTAHLLSFGHREIAFINGPAEASFVQRRREGYQTTLRAAQATVRPRFHVCGPMTEEFGMLETIRLFQSGSAKPTAIIASNMLIANGIFRAARLMGLRIPQDVSVVAHDDCVPGVGAEDMPVPLTATVAPLHEAWGQLARSLDAVIRGGDVREHGQISPHRLVVRQSVHAVGSDGRSVTEPSNRA